MQCLLFTKILKGLTLDEMGDLTSRLGFDGNDLLIRDGHQLTPSAPQNIVPAVTRLREFGLTVPTVTTDITVPEPGRTEKVFAACAEAGVKLIRLGYWMYSSTDRYEDVLDQARRHLAMLTSIGERFDVRLMIQLHGGTIHSSGSLTAALLRGFDPSILGAYPDPGNMAVQDGREDWRLTFDILSPWMCLIGVKNGGWSFGDRNANGQRRWVSDWLGLADGMVPWDEILAWLVVHNINVPLSFHGHYVMPFAQAVEQTRADLSYVRGILARLDATSAKSIAGRLI